MNFIQKYIDLGYSFFNTQHPDKKISTQWTTYQTRKPSRHEIAFWLKSSIQNWAIVCGKVSNLIVFDVDTKNGGDPTPFMNRGFYEVHTPSGGFHFYTLYNPLINATKHKKEKHTGILKGVDVQSDGSVVFAAPTAFFSKGYYTLEEGKPVLHPSLPNAPKVPYKVVNDVPLIPIPDDLLVSLLEALEPEKESQDYTPFTPIQKPEMGRPGDIFNALASWEDVLYPLGWTKCGTRGPTTYWRRPGKTEGVSASTNWKGYGLFFPYTKHYDELIWKKGYTKFNLLATLKYNGDYRTAAKELVLANYRLVNKLI